VAGPAWDDLPIGAAGTVLTSNGVDPSWQAPAGGGAITKIVNDWANVQHVGAGVGVLKTVNIPAGAMSTDGMLRITFELKLTGGMNKVTDLVFGGVTLWSIDWGFNTADAVKLFWYIVNRHATNSQLSFLDFYQCTSEAGGLTLGGHNAGITTCAVDTTVIVALTVQTTGTVDMRGWAVELFDP
jgi:hypothetical protein